MILLLSLAILAGVCRAVCSKLVFHFDRSVFACWRPGWDPKKTSNNKYKNRDPAQGPRFWGSTTVFVWLTDPFHLFQAGFLASYAGACFLAGTDPPGWLGLLFLLVAMGVEKMTFEVTFSDLLEK
jgi:hypothetical protein